MRKIVIHRPGGYGQLQMEEHSDLLPGPGEVVVKTRAAGVNYADVCVRWGVYESAKKYVGWPITPGFEFAGEVSAVGPGVTQHKVGDRVFGIVFFGAYASQVKVRAEHVFPIPKALSTEQAAGFLAVHLTAYHALKQLVVIRPGQWALVHSAAGGVGTALLQIAKIIGLKTVAVVGSSHKVETARKFGADHVIDKSSQPLWEEAKRLVPQGFDFVLDANGPATLREGYEALRPTGRMISYGYHTMLPKTGGKLQYLKAAWGMIRMPRYNPMRLCNENKSIVAFNLSFLFDREDLVQEGVAELVRWLGEGKLVPPLVETYSLAEVARAHQRIESGMSVGKLVLLS